MHILRRSRRAIAAVAAGLLTCGTAATLTTSAAVAGTDGVQIIGFYNPPSEHIDWIRICGTNQHNRFLCTAVRKVNSTWGGDPAVWFSNWWFKDWVYAYGWTANPRTHGPSSYGACWEQAKMPYQWQACSADLKWLNTGRFVP